MSSKQRVKLKMVKQITADISYPIFLLFSFHVNEIEKLYKHTALEEM